MGGVCGIFGYRLSLFVMEPKKILADVPRLGKPDREPAGNGEELLPQHREDAGRAGQPLQLHFAAVAEPQVALAFSQFLHN